MPNSLKIISLKCRNQKGKKNTKLVETSSFFLQASPPLDIKYPIIDNISISYNLMKHYVENAIKIVILRSHYIFKIQSLENLTKESPYIYIWNIMNYLLFLVLKWNMKNKIIIQHPGAKLDLNNWGAHNESSKLLWPCLSF